MLHREEVEADCLAALMVLDKSLEPVPEPFRMQPDVLLLVSFDEYKRFIESLRPDDNVLYYETYKLQRAVCNDNERGLLKAFYVDMALSVGKELSFASMLDRDATNIRHTFAEEAPLRNIDVTQAASKNLRSLLYVRGFDIFTKLSLRNNAHWDYACKLIQAAMDGPTKWVQGCE